MSMNDSPVKAPSLPLYFDNHATTPVDPRVAQAMIPYLTEFFGNPESSQHPYGWKAKAAIEKARGQVAKLINAETGEIVFTSGATESIHLAILGFLEEQPAYRHIITANTEHKATLEVCARAKKFGHEVTVLPVDEKGRITAQQVEQAMKPHTALVTLMHANNEIGTIHPVSEIGALTKARGLSFHVDAAQTAGKNQIDVKAMNIDLLSISAHKLYGPKGVGALYVRRSSPRVHLSPYIVGGGQERGLRGGTHNVHGIVGLGEACAIAMASMSDESARLAKLRDQLVSSIRREIPDVRFNGDLENKLCNNVSVTVQGVAPDDLLLGLSDIAYSAGSACSSGTASHVLAAITKDVGELNDPLSSTLRFGLGRFTTDADVETLARRFAKAVNTSRAAR